MDKQVMRRYLRLLRVAPAAPGRDHLATLVAAHMMSVPFENISKLYYRKRGFTGLPTTTMFLDGIERFHFGGTCYANNFHFYSLLAALDYDVKLCSADMQNPDVHMVSIVKLNGHEYLIDVGYAAPFLAPLPRDLVDDYVISLGADRYVLKPQDAQGCSRLELHRNGVHTHFYVAKPAPRKVGDFDSVIAASFRPSATFMNAILLARFYRDSSLVIHNLSIIASRGATVHTDRLVDKDELASAIETHFGIPQSMVREAIADVGGMQSAWG